MTGEFLMIFQVHGDLIVTGVTIKKAIEGLTGEFFKHLIHKGQWEVILPCSLIESSIVNAHSPSGDDPSWDQLILLICDYRHTSFRGNHLNRANP